MDRVDDPVEVSGGLGVNRDRVGAGVSELGDLRLGALDHQVAIDEGAGVVDPVGDRVDDQGPDRDRGNEVAVHDVDVDHPRPAASTSSTCSPSLAKSAERIEGATCRPSGTATGPAIR